jgi:hypothetical protein
MTFAGASLPWNVKRQAKQTGNYGALVNHMYKISLPYADASGKRVPETNELLHRHSYLTVGTQQSRLATANQWYHRYQDDRHWHDIFTLGRSMVGLPAVTVLRIKDFSRTRLTDGVVVESGTGATGSAVILEETASLIRTWPKRDEVLRMTISLGESYDVSGLPLTYDIRPLYENQARAATIQKLSNPGEFSVSFKYDPTLPRGRIPLIATASNGVLAGIPAFINAYFALPDQTPLSVLPYGSLDRPESVVQFNRRPQLVVEAPASQFVAPGSTVSFKVTCTDPEGFPTKIYRWLGEPGTLSGDTFSVTIPSAYEGMSLPFHFICSDGTGAYSSTELFVGVGKPGASGFILVDVGTMNSKSSITTRADGSFTLESDSAGRNATNPVETSAGALNWGIDHGSFLAMPVSSDFDITARVDSVSSLNGPTYLHPTAELLFRKTLSPDSPGDAIGVQRNDPDAFISRACGGTARLDYGTSDWRAYMYGCSSQPSTQTPTWLRLIRRSEGIAYFHSANGTEWEQTFSLPPDWRTNRLGAGFAGLFFAGRNIAKYPSTTPIDNSTTGSIPAKFNGLVRANTTNSLPLLFPASGKFGSDNDSRLSLAGGSSSTGAQIMPFAPSGSTGLLASYRQIASFSDTTTAPPPSVAVPPGEPIKIIGTGVFEVRVRPTFANGVQGEVVSLRVHITP